MKLGFIGTGTTLAIMNIAEYYEMKAIRQCKGIQQRF